MRRLREGGRSGDGSMRTLLGVAVGARAVKRFDASAASLPGVAAALRAEAASVEPPRGVATLGRIQP